jgi:MoaA/NifB/PqqE/SkfB family radical SAM enzyme
MKRTREHHSLDRVIFNFLDRCNMTCKYCYCPFLRQSVDPKLCHRIVAHCLHLGARVITFGGGDPFMYRFIHDLVKQARDGGVFVHVDTNALSMRKADHDAIRRHVGLVGLPLDGPDAQSHGRMRGSARHFDIVLGHLDRLCDMGVRVKVNTVASKLNIDCLVALAELLRNRALFRWSIYQFWPFDEITQANNEYGLPRERFDEELKRINSLGLPFPVEAGPVSERAGTYFFVTHTGLVYSNSAEQESQYQFLGSIFDDNTIDAWLRHSGGSMREAAKSRYDYRNGGRDHA